MVWFCLNLIGYKSGAETSKNAFKKLLINGLTAFKVGFSIFVRAMSATVNCWQEMPSSFLLDSWIAGLTKYNFHHFFYSCCRQTLSPAWRHRG